MIKSLKLFTAVLLLFLAIAQISCNSDDDNDEDDDSNTECENTICTLVLVRIVVSITDQDQNPVALDSFKVIHKENGNDMTLSLSSSELSTAQELGQYPLIEDGVLDVHQEQNLLFKGYINNQEVITSDYTVGTDCCHVGLVSGNLQLTL